MYDAAMAGPPVEPVVKKTGQAMIIVAVLPALFATLFLMMGSVMSRGDVRVMAVSGYFWAFVLVVLGVLITRRNVTAAAMACLLAALGSLGSVAGIFFSSRGNLFGLVFWAVVLGLAARWLYKVVQIIRRPRAP